MGAMALGRRHKILWIVAGVAAVAVVLAVAAPFVYIHFIEGPPPQKLQLPAVRTTTSTTPRGPAGSSAPDSSASGLDGTWNVGRGSLAGYRVQEVLIGQSTTAVGRTSSVWGSLTLTGSTVTKASFSVNMASVISDQSQRNAQFDGRIMDVAQYPTATFTLTSPIDLGTIPANGAVGHYTATGTLAMHGVTKTVTFPVSAEVAGDEIDVLADVTIQFADWNIANPSIGGFVTTADSGTLEVLLDLTQGQGNAPSSSSGSNGFVGGGGPVTVPSTTVPPLSVPNG